MYKPNAVRRQYKEFAGRLFAEAIIKNLKTHLRPYSSEGMKHRSLLMRDYVLILCPEILSSESR